MGKHINVVSSRNNASGRWVTKLPGGTKVTSVPQKTYSKALKNSATTLSKGSKPYKRTETEN